MLISILLFAQMSFAASVESETTIGTYSNEESISLNGDLIEKPPKAKRATEHIPFSVNYAQTNTKSTDANNVEVKDITKAFSANLGYESKRHFEFGAGYNYSTTPNENLVSLGPEASVGYMPESDSDNFERSIGVKFTAATNAYVETFTATGGPLTKRGKTRPVTGSNQIIQSSFQIETPVKTFEWLTLRPSATFYHYNTDVSTFLDYLTSKRLSLSTIGLQNSAASLASFESELQATFYLFESWELLLNEDYAVLASDKSNSWASKAEVFYDLDDWRFGVGYSNLRSLPANDDALIINVSYDF